MKLCFREEINPAGAHPDQGRGQGRTANSEGRCFEGDGVREWLESSILKELHLHTPNCKKQHPTPVCTHNFQFISLVLDLA